jgi:non-heme chloroperoxidase
MPIVLANGIGLSFTQHGDPHGPAVVFLPGPTDSWRSYDAVLASMPPTLRSVAVSLRGHGDSSKPPAGYSIVELASDVVPFLDQLSIDTAVLVGHSGSCLVARRVALDHPDRVSGLVLEASPTTLRGNGDLVHFIDSFVATVTDPIDRHVARSFVTDTSTAELSSSTVDQLVDEVVKVPAVAWQEMFASLLAYDDSMELARLTVPVLMLWGECDPLIGRAMQETLRTELPRAELRVYEGAGHTPRWEQPTRFASDVASFTHAVNDMPFTSSRNLPEPASRWHLTTSQGSLEP